MKWYYHLKGDGTCLYDQEEWPCTAAMAVLDFVRDSNDAILIKLAQQAFHIEEDEK